MSAAKRTKSEARTGRTMRMSGGAVLLERAVQRSVSLRPSQWRMLDQFGLLTEWGRNGAIAQAVDLYTALPLTTVQRIATLRHTTAGETLRKRIRGSLEEALKAAEAELPDNPFAEFDAILSGTADAFVQSGAADMSPSELAAAAEKGKRESRTRRLG